MKVVVLGAGLATRMRGAYPDTPKGLIRVAKRELVYRTMKFLKELGFNSFVVVTNPVFSEAYERFMKVNEFNGEIVLNEHPERGNGYSLYLARGHVEGKFILVMTDHVYERGFIERAVKGNGLVVDREGRFIEHGEATKVRLRDGKVADIGKKLEVFDAFDTGFFVLEDSIFSIAEGLIEKRDHVELSDIVREASLVTTEISGLLWADADTPEELKKLRKLIVRSSVKGVGDGWVSRLFNRRISTLLSTYLCEYVSPYVMTWFSFLIGVVSSVVAFFSPPLGGIVYQVSSILDGVDGEIARATLQESELGGWLDSLLDRMVDFGFLLALYHRLPNSYGYVYACAIFGVVMVSYSTERFRGAFGKDAYKSVKFLSYLPGKRDERIFIVMVMCLLGLIKGLIVLLALVTNVRVLFTMYLVWQWNKKRTRGGWI